MNRTLHRNLMIIALSLAAAACFTVTPGELGRGPRHGWWDGLGEVLPHDSFPADCNLCHLPQDWSSLRPGFDFDHLAETGVELEGSHAAAQCLRCHNDRSPSQVLSTLSCTGCHEDVHSGHLGADCTSCHDQLTWQAVGQRVMHDHQRFPLVGIHASTSCWRCHPGEDAQRFTPTPTDCVACHTKDLNNANNPDHNALGWVDRCDSCHVPLLWQAAELDPNFASGSGASSTQVGETAAQDALAQEIVGYLKSLR